MVVPHLVDHRQVEDLDVADVAAVVLLNHQDNP